MINTKLDSAYVNGHQGISEEQIMKQKLYRCFDLKSSQSLLH